MRIRGITFNPVFCASGSRNINGDGYWYHRLLRLIGLLDYENSTLVAKTVTIERRVGNMPLKSDGQTPHELIPRCIYRDSRHKLALNCVGLSNFGLPFYLENGYWQNMLDPFFLSFMAVKETPEERLEEDRQFVAAINKYRGEFQSPFGLQRNFAYPNTGHNPVELIDEIWASLDILGELGIPIIIKSNLEMPVETAVRLSNHPACDGICMTNTIPFGKLPHLIRWNKYFPDEISPLTKRGFAQPGGLSGKPLLKPMTGWLRDARKSGFKKLMIGCGGILSPRNVKKVVHAGASGMEIGSAAFLAPCQVRRIIREANSHLVCP